MYDTHDRSPSSALLFAAPRLNPDFTVRFDALLISPEDAARRVRGAVTAALNSSGSNDETSPSQHGWRGWGLEEDQAIAVGVQGAMAHAADSVYDEIEEEIVASATRGDELRTNQKGWSGHLKIERPSK